MTEIHKGLLISLATHILILPFFFGLFTGLHNKTHAISVDFTLLSNDRHTKGAANPGSTGQVNTRTTPLVKSEKTLTQTDHNKNEHARQPTTMFAEPEKTSTILSQRTAMVSDPQSSAIFHPQTAPPANISTAGDTRGQNQGVSSTDSSNSATGSGQRGNKQASGYGGNTLPADGKDYAYIRDAVMKNIKYPEKARRMGFEGKILLSFIVLENGTTSDVKVVKSSGRRLLDENALEGVAKTLISRQVPYRVVVVLPIVYKLEPPT